MEEQAYFNALREATSESLAYFYCCIKYDLPFDMNAVPPTGGSWEAYKENLRLKQLDKSRRSKRVYGFLDGLTDITKIFGDLEKGEFSKAVDLERSARTAKAGSNRQRAEWGGVGKYTNEDYDYLDEKYETLSKRPKEAGTLDEQQQLSLHTVARLYLELDKALDAGKADNVNKINKAIQDIMAAESLRKRDAKPIAEVRIDNFIDAVEKQILGNKKMKMLSEDELMEKIFSFARKKKYSMTLDAAEHALWYIRNCAAKNDGYEELPDVTEDMRFPDDVAQEFADEPTEEEKATYADLGLLRKGEENGRRETPKQ